MKSIGMLSPGELELDNRSDIATARASGRVATAFAFKPSALHQEMPGDGVGRPSREALTAKACAPPVSVLRISDLFRICFVSRNSDFGFVAKEHATEVVEES